MRTLALAIVLSCASRDVEIGPEPTDRVVAPNELPGSMLAFATTQEVERRVRVPGECTLGQERECTPGGLSGHGGGPYQYCVLANDDSHQWSRASCNTPLVVAFTNSPIEFTRPDDARRFPIGLNSRTEWVSPKTPWLALDQNGNDCVDDQSELFGADGSSANGFEKLARLDDNQDGRIDASDSAFSRLSLWTDEAPFQRCASSELRPLSAFGVVTIDLHYASSAPTRDGSYEGEHATLLISDARGMPSRMGRIVDVHLAPIER